MLFATLFGQLTRRVPNSDQAVYQEMILVLAGVVLYAFIKARREGSKASQEEAAR